MTRRAAALEGRGKGAVGLAAGVLLALSGGLAYLALRPAPQVEPPAPGPAPVTERSPAASALVAVPAPMPEPTPRPPPLPAVVAVAAPPKERAPSPPDDAPYRFLGKAAPGTGTSIVLFGRGRIVDVSGPGPLDDEYVVEGLFDDYLVIRHLPSGVGKFLELANRQQVVTPPGNPEESPPD